MPVRVTVLYDNKAFVDGVKADHGFSCLIEGHGERVLFDAGSDPDILRSNARSLGLDLDVDVCVLSHFHTDHIGGRSAVRAGEFYVLDSFWRSTIEELENVGEVTVVSNAIEIRPWLLTTGPLGERTKEQSVVVRGDKMTLLLTGCGHPGLDNILRAAAGYGVNAVMGGFHGFDRLDVLGAMELIVPCHCTAYSEEIKSLYPEKHMNCGVGTVLDL